MSNEPLGLVEEARKQREKFARFIRRRVSYELSNEELQAHIKEQVSAQLKAEVDRIIAEREERRRQEEVEAAPPSGIHVKDIIQAVAEVSGLDYADFAGPRRSRKLSYPRHVAMLLVVEMRSDLSLPAIGRVFGNRDHTTCMAGRDRARERIANISSASADWYRAAKALLAERFPEASK